MTHERATRVHHHESDVPVRPERRPRRIGSEPAP